MEQESNETLNTLIINADIGLGNNSLITQFIKSIVELSIKYGVKIIMAYYPQYHSKYNPELFMTIYPLSYNLQSSKHPEIFRWTARVHPKNFWKPIESNLAAYMAHSHE